MRFQESLCKMRQSLTLILVGLIICGLFIMTSVCLAAGDKWTEKADMPTARDSFSTSVVNDKIYAIGGWVPGDIAIATVEEYDPATDKWTSKADMPTARFWLSTSVVDSKIYAIGGLKRNPDRVISTVEEYDPAADKWTKKADMSTARDCLSTSVVNGKVYAIGGRPRHAQVWDGLSTVEVYDPATDKWTKKADMPTGRASFSTSVVDGKIYAIGGGTAFVFQQRVDILSTVEVYNPVTDKWMKKTDMPTGRAGFSTSVVDGKIYAIGGTLGHIVGESLSTVELYDPATDRWTKKADMPTARDTFSADVVNGKIYAIGGWVPDDDIAIATVEEYTPEGWPFAVSPQDKLATVWGAVKSD